jgi:hypothetical protein
MSGVRSSHLLLLRASLLLLAALPSACVTPTSFRGKAHFPGGARACAARCAQDGLEMGGFVYSGEFASSCVCRAARAPAATSPPAAPAAAIEAEAAELGQSAAVGIVLAMRAAAERQRQLQQRGRPQRSRPPGTMRR